MGEHLFQEIGYRGESMELECSPMEMDLMSHAGYLKLGCSLCCTVSVCGCGCVRICVWARVLLCLVNQDSAK